MDNRGGAPPTFAFPEDFRQWNVRDQYKWRRAVFEQMRRYYAGLNKFRPDLAAMKFMRDNGLSLRFQGIGHVPGVRVNDTFKYRSEMVVVGLHRSPQTGISYDVHNGSVLATCVAISGGYEDDKDLGSVIHYTGQGGQNEDHQQVKDQKSRTAANKAMQNAFRLKTPVRVVRKLLGAVGSTLNFRYEGLYDVFTHETKPGISGHLIFSSILKQKQ